ncbi:MAG: GNAT family N-acetyltransferase [Rhodoglobus sp.]|nr:GNAT family N-acetyltransferase [Rhodoglobus sp.]
MNQQPLNQRVVAPVVALPVSTEAVTWRRATVSDIDAVLDCEREIAAADHPYYVSTREELTEDFEQSYVDVAVDTLVALAPDGQVLAWGLVLEPPGQDTLVREILVGGVRPAHRGRGIGRELLAWQVARGQERLAASERTIPGWLMTVADVGVADAHRLYARSDLTPARYFLELRRDLGTPVEPVALDPELELVPFGPDWSEATRIARNDSFRDHWGSQPMLEEPWQALVGRSTFRDDLSFVAVAPDRTVAGFVLSTVSEDDWPGQGFSSAYIEYVGVTRTWRRRGVAPALLAHALAAIAAAGLDKAVLDVDSDSPTGALGLYTGVGFAESNRSINYTRVY